MQREIVIRDAHPGDAQGILAVYDPYVRHTAITFEYVTPDEEEMRARIERTMSRYPYLVALIDGRIVGYAYAGAYYARAAYDWCAEVSVYLSQDAKGMGIGRRLYQALEQALGKMGVVTLYACIAVPHGQDDAYLTRNSEQFHAHMGYRLCGTFSRCGYKFSRWYDMIWMEKVIGVHREDQPAIMPYPLIR